MYLWTVRCTPANSTLAAVADPFCALDCVVWQREMKKKKALDMEKLNNHGLDYM